MRSYKDCLVEYLEETEFERLNSEWYVHFSELLDLPNNFQIMTGFPSLKGMDDLKYYSDLIPSDHLYHTYHFFNQKKRSDIYKCLVKNLMRSEVEKIRKFCKQNVFDWKSCSESLNFFKNDNYKSFSKSFYRCIENSNLSLIELIAQGHLDEVYLGFIDDFFDEENYFLDRPDYQISDTAGSKNLYINFASSAYGVHNHSLWSEKVVRKGSRFFESGSFDFSEINSLISQSDIKITGELSGMNKYLSEEKKWMRAELMILLFEEKTNGVKERIAYPQRREMVDKLNRRINTFYTITGFDICIEVKKTLSDAQMAALREKKYTLFPFHFSEKVKHYKWIDNNEKGDLRIRIKKVDNQPCIIGAELDFARERHF